MLRDYYARFIYATEHELEHKLSYNCFWHKILQFFLNDINHYCTACILNGLDMDIAI